ncbi:MAG: InlB B-repeat-containing protein, partial [Firmicutes bacterium]|nr:InlB B-repeat-containing protein [Bacillota bacterium]
NGEIIEITAGTVILRDTNVRLYFHGSDVPTAGLQKLASPNNVRLSPVASAPLLIWDNVPNASGYLVSVAGGTAQTVNSNQFNLSAVTAEGEHLILVTAKGDGVTYADSNATAYMYLIVKSGGGGETEIISVNFTAGELQVALNAMSSNPMPPTGFPNWGVLLSFFGKSDLEAFKKEVMAQISLDKGFKVVDIYLLGGAPITVNTQLNPNYMISYEAPKSQPTLNTIAFNAGLGKFLDGTSAKTVEVPNGTAVGTMETPTRAGFTFMGWYENQFAYDLNEPTTRSWNLQAMWNDNGGNQGENPSQAVQADLMNTFRGINQSIVTPNPPQTWGMAMSQGGYSSLNALIEAVKLRISATNGGKAVTNIVQVGLYGASVEITMTTQINSNTMIIAYFA